MEAKFYAGGIPISNNNVYERVFVILQDGTTRQYDNVEVYLFDNQLSVVAKEREAIFNFNNIVGVNLIRKGINEKENI